MGIKDATPLHEIYDQAKLYCKKYKLPFSFTVDNGSFETAIEFFFYNKWQAIHPPIAKDWNKNPIIFCPDILDFENHIIIEYEEEGQKILSGARLARKGHGPAGDISNNRDARRGEYYKLANFRVLRFYEAGLKEENWEKLHDFLLECVE